MVGGRWYRRAATRATPRSHAARKKRIAPACLRLATGSLMECSHSTSTSLADSAPAEPLAAGKCESMVIAASSEFVSPWAMLKLRARPAPGTAATYLLSRRVSSAGNVLVTPTPPAPAADDAPVVMMSRSRPDSSASSGCASASGDPRIAAPGARSARP
eukprot:scaffold58638_cov63-Phaeocystis_antarctica.AAC.3